MIAAILNGCDGKKLSGENNKEKVTVALWGNQMLENYTQYLCDTFPEVDFEFILATNSTDYYRYRQEHGDMPDILSVRRFVLKEKAGLSEEDAVMDNREPKDLFIKSKAAMFRILTKTKCIFALSPTRCFVSPRMWCKKFCLVNRKLLKKL